MFHWEKNTHSHNFFHYKKRRKEKSAGKVLLKEYPYISMDFWHHYLILTKFYKLTLFFAFSKNNGSNTSNKKYPPQSALPTSTICTFWNNSIWQDLQGAWSHLLTVQYIDLVGIVSISHQSVVWHTFVWNISYV